METYTFYCDECHTIVHVVASNTNAFLNSTCYGQDDEEPLKGSHEPKRMRMIGTRPLNA